MSKGQQRKQGTAYSKSTITAELKRVSDILGHPPVQRQFNNIADMHSSTVRSHFGSWSNGLEKAGLDPSARPGVTGKKQKGTRYAEGEILRELRRLTEELGRPPTKREFDDLGKMHGSTVRRNLGNWETAIEKAGLDVRKIPKRGGGGGGGGGGNGCKSINDEELIDALIKFSEEIGRTATFWGMSKHGPYAASTYVRRFGSWNNAIKKAGLEKNSSGAEGEIHPRWKEGERPRCRTSVWERRAGKVRKRDGNECFFCSLSSDTHKAIYGMDLHVHHVKPKRTFEDPRSANETNNLLTLCATCHLRTEARLFWGQ